MRVNCTTCLQQKLTLTTRITSNTSGDKISCHHMREGDEDFTLMTLGTGHAGASAAIRTQPWKASSTTSAVLSACNSMYRKVCSCRSALSVWKAARYRLYTARQVSCLAPVPLCCTSGQRPCCSMLATMHGCKYQRCVQVFISEQILYNRQDLERHQRQGDLTGPLAESGFKGHPNCRCATWQTCPVLG